MAIQVGSPAPDFALKDQNQKEIKLADYKGKKVVIVFYPLDWSPVCTNEHTCLVNDMKRFDELDAQVLGISVDRAWSHKAFAEKMGIKYPLLADFQPRGGVGEKYGVFLAEKRHYRTLHHHHRSLRENCLVQELRYSHCSRHQG